jgi:hypothetical protein
MVRLVESDEYSNGKRYGEFEFTTKDTKQIIELIQNPSIYCSIDLTLEELDKLITDVEREPGKYTPELIKSLKGVREQYAYQRPITTSP